MSVKKNFMYNIMYQILILITPFLTAPYIARVIGPDGLGVYSYTHSIGSYFVLIAMLGINNYGNRKIAQVRQNKNELNRAFSSIVYFQVAVASIITILYLLYIIFIVKNNKIIFIIQLLYVSSAIFDINWFFFGMEKFKITVTRNMIIKLASVLSIFIFVKDQNDLIEYTLIMSMGIFISQTSLWVILPKYVSLVKVSISDILKNFKPCIILFAPVIAVSIYKTMDKIMLGFIAPMSHLGFYENSDKLISIPLSIITALGTVMLPRISNLASKGEVESSRKYMDSSMKFSMFISIGSIFGLMGISSVFIPIFLGEEFVYCINLTKILSISILFIAWANVVRTQFLIPNKKDRIYITSTFLGAITNFIVNIMLIRKYGAIGTAIGTIVAEFSVAFYQTIKVKNEIPVWLYIKESFIFVISGAIMYICIVIIGNKFNSSIFTTLIQILVGGIIYCLCIFIYKAISSDKKLIFCKNVNVK